MKPSNADTGKTVQHVQRTDGHEITLKLTDAQKSELSRLAGKDLTHIKIGIQELADIGDLVAN